MPIRARPDRNAHSVRKSVRLPWVRVALSALRRASRKPREKNQLASKGAYDVPPACPHAATRSICPLLNPFFAGLVVVAGSKYPIPSRTRPLNSPAPMVLSLKAWKSRSLPGLQKTEQNHDGEICRLTMRWLVRCAGSFEAKKLKKAATVFRGGFFRYSIVLLSIRFLPDAAPAIGYRRMRHQA